MSFIGTLSQTLTLRALVLIPPPHPPFKGAIRACGLSIATRLPLLANSGPASDDALLNPANPIFKGAHQAFVRTRAHGHRFAVLRPASDNALLNPTIPIFKGVHQGLRAFHRRTATLPADSGPASDDALVP